MSDVPGDPGSQLPYQEFSPYYLAPIRLVFSHWRSRRILGFARFCLGAVWSLFLCPPSHTLQRRAGRATSLSHLAILATHMGAILGFFCDIAISYPKQKPQSQHQREKWGKERRT